MSSITPYGSSPGLSRSQGRAIQQHTTQIAMNAVVANTRLAAAEFVAFTAMQHTVALAKHAVTLADGDAYLGSRLGAVVDSYVNYAASEVTRVGRWA